ncbi:RAD51-associated protein 1 isoform X2 [Latimeria chalumnae]|uniref:RAD51-associated protein 1 isoform X2 n=1 Tax=Latimeria chalumnae TaxID=7897 RepID=UPI0003C12195|nr:PREDICTED: RAD51-associated protein 1 isoform X2 [Latimeria chalumnae]|eukprot:XP_005989337.1 PREDICTED: RAD51-associated protein 1 isoform X2 [Latimeria chalumnae]
MERLSRNKKRLDYSQFGDFGDDDEDFACVAAPASKKSRVTQKEPKQEKKQKLSKKAQSQETLLQRKSNEERISLDDKLYQRDLEAALVLSMQETTKENAVVLDSQQEGDEKCADTEMTRMDGGPLLSNCSVDSNLLGLDRITDEKDLPTGGHRQRQAASKATTQQKKLLVDDQSSDDEGERDDTYEPNFIADKESDSDPDFSNEDDEDEVFNVKRGTKRIGNNVKGKLKTQVGKKEKKSTKSRLNATVTPVISSPSTAKVTSHPALKKTITSPQPVSTPLQTQSPSIGIRKPKWTPPASSGSSSKPLGGAAVKSPNHGLRLGLSRLARVKPLHPSVANN